MQVFNFVVLWKYFHRFYGNNPRPCANVARHKNDCVAKFNLFLGSPATRLLATSTPSNVQTSHYGVQSFLLFLPPVVLSWEGCCFCQSFEGFCIDKVWSLRSGNFCIFYFRYLLVMYGDKREFLYVVYSLRVLWNVCRAWTLLYWF